MTRPAHITVLDAALVAKLAERGEAKAEYVRLREEHAAILSAVDGARRRAAQAELDARAIDQAIRGLGFTVSA